MGHFWNLWAIFWNLWAITKIQYAKSFCLTIPIVHILIVKNVQFLFEMYLMYLYKFSAQFSYNDTLTLLCIFRIARKNEDMYSDKPAEYHLIVQ